MPDAFPLPPLEPTRDLQATLPDLIEVLLNKGVILHLDLIISVADIPLIGVSLKAAIAGIETMLEYGMMRQWDEQTRAWVQRSISRSVPFLEDEELIARMAGGVEQTGLYTAWRPGTVYLTNRRLFVFRREPREMLWESRLDAIRTVDLDEEPSIGGEKRHRLSLKTDDGSVTRVSAAEPQRLVSLVRRELADGGASPRPANAPAERPPLRQGQLWYHEPRAGGAVWRGGAARLDAAAGLSWKSPLDARPAVSLVPDDIRRLKFESGRSPAGSTILALETEGGQIARFAASNIASWAETLTDLLERRLETGLRLPTGSEEK